MTDRAGFEKASGARAQHLHCGQLRGQALVLGAVRQEARYHPAPELLLETDFDGVGNVTSGQRISGDVNVGIDETRRDDEAAAVDEQRRIEAGHDLACRSDRGDPIGAQRDRAIGDDAVLGIEGYDDRTGN